MTGEPELRVEVASAAAGLEGLGLTQGTSGNVSARLASDTFDGMLITPSAVACSTVRPHDLVLVELGGAVSGHAAEHPPSTEWRMHAAILERRRDVGAVVHAHPPWATALACLRRDIPPFHYMVAAAGGDVIRCAEYATFGTDALAEAALEALEDRRACLLANHGMIACGATAADALALAVEVEALAGHYLRALAVGEPALLSAAEMERVLRRFGAYGRPHRRPRDGRATQGGPRTQPER